MQTEETGIMGFPPNVLIQPAPPKVVAEESPKEEINTAPKDGEAAKYTKMWENKNYRTCAPGENVYNAFLQLAKPNPGDTVIDCGCGTGRGALMLALIGRMNVTMVDFAENCLDPDVKDMLVTQSHALRFIKGDLREPIRASARYAFCFPEGTYISGSNKYIDELEVGDEVTDSKGVLQKVIEKYERVHSGDMVRIRAACTPDIFTTPEHPIQVCEVSRIHRGATKEGVKAVYEHVASTPVWKDAKDVVEGDWVSIPRITECREFKFSYVARYKEMERTLDEGLAWLLGLFVAEGSFGVNGRMVLSLGAHERDIAERALAEYTRLGVGATISQPPAIKAQNGLHVIANCVSLAALFKKWCGVYSDNVQVPDIITYAHEPIVRAFIAGLVEGDGCLRKDEERNRNGRYAVSTVSRKLAYGLQSLLHKVGVHASLPNPDIRDTLMIQGRLCKVKPAYTVQWSKNSWDGTNDAADKVPHGSARFIKDSVYLQVRSVVTEQVTNLPVYNIHTTDETYGVPFTVHNCTDAMEHIPTEDVDAVIANILHCAQSCFFQISTVPDHFGQTIGETLHLTVKPAEWWKEKFKEHGAVIHYMQDYPDSCIFYVSSWSDVSKLVEYGTLNTEKSVMEEQIWKNLERPLRQVSPHQKQNVDVILLGGGPSLNNYVDEIKEKRAAGAKLITTNGTYNWAIEHGLSPSAQIIVDAREFNKRFVEPIIPSCQYLLASQCHPTVFDAVPPEQTWLWHSVIAEEMAGPLQDYYNKKGEPWYPVPGGSTVMLRAIPLLRMLGFHRMEIYGFDSCLGANGAHHAYAQPENDYEKILKVSCGGKIFFCHPWQASQGSELIDLLRLLLDEIELIVHGDGLIAHILETGAAEFDKEEAEKAEMNVGQA